jgi:hypothetical protein
VSVGGSTPETVCRPNAVKLRHRASVRMARAQPGFPGGCGTLELSASPPPLLLLSVEGQEQHLPRPGDGALDGRCKGEDYRYPFAADLVENS